MDTKTEVQWPEMKESRTQGDRFLWVFLFPFEGMDARVEIEKTIRARSGLWQEATVGWQGRLRLDAPRAARFAAALTLAAEIARELDELHPAGSPYTPPQPGADE